MTHMRPNFSIEALNRAVYLIGSPDTVEQMPSLPVRESFSEEAIDFLNTVSKLLMGERDARAYPDVTTLAFWLRRASLNSLKARFAPTGSRLCLGRGVAFHIAPSNVPVNYAYSMAAGLLTGNANVIRVPSKDFPQVDLINRALEKALAAHENMRPYLCLMRYDRSREVNDALSAIADVRIVWGGDATIMEIRRSPLPPRSTEVTFADRFSLAVIDSDAYLAMEDKKRVALDFYNDTYLTDQNACTSPRLVVWTGSHKEQAKAVFWDALHELVISKYTFQPIMGVNKMTSACLAGVALDGVRQEPHTDNYLVRVRISEPTPALIDLRDNSGFFFEYDCDDLMKLRSLCADDRCQTLGYIGNREMFKPLLLSGIKGIDRIVPIGKSMDFDLIWDGYDLTERLTRIICI